MSTIATCWMARADRRRHMLSIDTNSGQQERGWIQYWTVHRSKRTSSSSGKRRDSAQQFDRIQILREGTGDYGVIMMRMCENDETSRIRTNISMPMPFERAAFPLFSHSPLDELDQSSSVYERVEHVVLALKAADLTWGTVYTALQGIETHHGPRNAPNPDSG